MDLLLGAIYERRRTDGLATSGKFEASLNNNA